MTANGAKVVLLGEMGVGKSSIAGRTKSDTFLDSYQATIGATFTTKHIVDGDSQYKFYIWDTAGKEKFRTLAPLYYRDAAAAILIYDISAKASFDCIPYWISELRKHGPPNIIIVLAGNKCDCGDELREIPFRFLASYATEKGIPYFECSAKTGENVREILVEIGRHLPSDFVTRKKETTRLLNPTDPTTLCWPFGQHNCSII
ncbi:ras-related protein Rab-22A-like [Diadema setosum]|uniref:ras-related protein Rab-22A-like n=1 Tax=Diadema setosum TaxID=31175 RepID=UPI003B3B696C